MMMLANEIVESPVYTGFVLATPGPDGRERLINVTEQEWRKHRMLMACTARAETPVVIFKKDIF